MKTSKKYKIIVIIIAVILIIIGASAVILPSLLENYKTNRIVSEYLQVTEVCNSLIGEYSDENGFIELSKQKEVLDKLYEASKELKKDGAIKNSYYKDNDTGVVIELNSGIKCFCAPMIDGYLSGTGNAEIVTVRPYDDLSNDSWEHIRNHCQEIGLKEPEQIASDLQQNFSFLSYNSNHKGFVGSIEYLLGLKDNSVVMWRGHGGYNKECGSILGINSEGGLLINSEAKKAKANYAKTIIENYYSKLLDNSLLLMSDGETLAVTAKFFESMPENTFKNSLFYLAACDSIMDCYDSLEGGLAESIIRKGAVAVIGNTGVISTRYNGKMLETVFEELAVQNSDGRYKSLEEALNFAKSIHGEYDANNVGTTVQVVCPENYPDNRHRNLPYFYSEESGVIDDAESDATTDIVIDALNYEKPVNVIDENLSEEFRTHRIIIPKLVGETENITKFNQQIYDRYIKAYDILIADNEGQDIFLCDYKYIAYEDLIAVAVEYDQTVQAGGSNAGYEVYYYDLNNDGEITFEEYLERLGIGMSFLTKKVKENKAYSQIQENLLGFGMDLKIVDALINDEKVMIYYDTSGGFIDWQYAIIEANIFEKDEELVVDALNYEKDVVSHCYEIHGDNYSCDLGKHRVKLPKISRETEAAKALNEKMYNSVSDVYAELLNNEEDSRIHDIAYEYKEFNGILSIGIEETHGVQHGGGWSNYHTYYYDIINDKEITFIEYLEHAQLDKSTLFKKVRNKDQYLEMREYISSYTDSAPDILGALLSKDEAVIVFAFENHYEEFGPMICSFDNINIFEE